MLPAFSPYPKRNLAFGLRLALLIALLAYVLHRLDLQELRRDLGDSNWILIVAAIAALSLQVSIAAWRWVLILRDLGSNLRITVAVRLILMGMFLSQILPGAIAGDAMRMWLTVKTGCSVKNAVNSVALDRLIMLVVLFSLAALTMLTSKNDLISYESQLALMLLAIGLIGTCLIMACDKLPHGFYRWRVFRAVAYLAADARIILLNWRFASILVALCVISYFNMSGCMYLFAVAIGQKVDFWSFFFLSLPVLLVSMLPISIGGWGTREISAIALLGTIGIDPTSALLISVLFGLASILISLPGGVLYAMNAGYARSSGSPG